MENDPRVIAMLALIAWSEETSTSPITQDDGYDIIVTGVHGRNRFDNYADHPFANGRPPIIWHLNPLETSTASGRYQLEVRWWPAYKAQLKLQDFGHASQDAVAVQQMSERHAIAPLLAGDTEQAILNCDKTWASFPGNSYGQGGGKTMAQLLAQYEQILG